MISFVRDVINTGFAIAAHSPVQWFFERRAANFLTVLVYHKVEDASTFAQHARIVRERLHALSIHEVIDAISGKRSWPKRAALITFDDGERCNFEIAAPILRDHGLPSIAFVIPGLIDTSESAWYVEVAALVERGAQLSDRSDRGSAAMVAFLKTLPDEGRLRAIDELRKTATQPAPAYPQLRREELLLMESMGMAIGNHTMTHPCLDRCSTEKIHDEVFRTHERLGELLGKYPVAFAYPNGDQDQRVVQAVRECGYRVAFLFDHRLARIPCADPLAISRVRTNSLAGVEKLNLILSGLHPALHHARGGS